MPARSEVLVLTTSQVKVGGVTRESIVMSARSSRRQTRSGAPRKSRKEQSEWPDVPGKKMPPLFSKEPLDASMPGSPKASKPLLPLRAPKNAPLNHKRMIARLINERDAAEGKESRSRSGSFNPRNRIRKRPSEVVAETVKRAKIQQQRNVNKKGREEDPDIDDSKQESLRSTPSVAGRQRRSNARKAKKVAEEYTPRRSSRQAKRFVKEQRQLLKELSRNHRDDESDSEDEVEQSDSDIEVKEVDEDVETNEEKEQTDEEKEPADEEEEIEPSEEEEEKEPAEEEEYEHTDVEDEQTDVEDEQTDVEDEQTDVEESETVQESSDGDEGYEEEEPVRYSRRKVHPPAPFWMSPSKKESTSSDPRKTKRNQKPVNNRVESGKKVISSSVPRRVRRKVFADDSDSDDDFLANKPKERKRSQFQESSSESSSSEDENPKTKSNKNLTSRKKSKQTPSRRTRIKVSSERLSQRRRNKPTEWWVAAVKDEPSPRTTGTKRKRPATGPPAKRRR